MILHQAQSKIAESKSRFRVVNCGRRFGKTILSCWEMFAFAVAKQDAKIAYIAPTYQQAKDIAWENLKKICQPVTVKIKETSPLEVLVANKGGGTSSISLRGWESVDTLRGQSFDFLVLDEVSMYKNFWINWQEVLRPTLTDRKGEALFISTPKGFNHFYDLFNLEKTDPDYKSFHFTTYDNIHLEREEIDKAKKELTEDRFAQEYLADFRKTEGLVYKEFDRDKHLFDEPGFEGEDFVSIKLFGGLDFGTTNPAAVIEIKKDKESNYWVWESLYKTGMTDSAIADYVSALKWNECYPDPESASGRLELEKRGVNVRDVIKNKDSIRNGINLIRELFKSNRLFISSSARNLIWELETYSYPEKRNNRNEDENPIKENDHALDALRYALSMEQNFIKKPVSIHKSQSSGYQHIRSRRGW